MLKPKQEQRSSQRRKVKATVPVRIDENRTELQAVTRDISQQGVYIYMEAKVMHGSMMEVVLPLPAPTGNSDEIWVRCKCRVLRVEETPDPQEYGVAASIEEFESVQQARVPQPEKPRV